VVGFLETGVDGNTPSSLFSMSPEALVEVLCPVLVVWSVNEKTAKRQMQ
jgi:hypothetical protein